MSPWRVNRLDMVANPVDVTGPLQRPLLPAEREINAGMRGFNAGVVNFLKGEVFHECLLTGFGGSFGVRQSNRQRIDSLVYYIWRAVRHRPRPPSPDIFFFDVPGTLFGFFRCRLQFEVALVPSFGYDHSIGQWCTFSAVPLLCFITSLTACPLHWG